MPYMPGASLVSRAVAAAALSIAIVAKPCGAADESVRIEWRPDPSAHYSADVHMTHVIANDLNGVYKKLAGSKADPVTILDDRTVDVTTGPNGAVDEAIVDVRHYGGLQAKDTSTIRRTSAYKGSIAPDGKRVPTDEPLVDAGDGPLSEFPDGPVSIGQTWTFSRQVLVDRDLGHGSMTYTDTLERVDVRGSEKIAVIGVKGAGRVDVAPDLKQKGFQTADMTFAGTAEFDTTTGLPGTQHYIGHVQWNTHVLWVHLGLVFDDTYDAVSWTLKGR
jgi:hypothetical protein